MGASILALDNNLPVTPGGNLAFTMAEASMHQK